MLRGGDLHPFGSLGIDLARFVIHQRAADDAIPCPSEVSTP
jgi:hypothetical protein